MSNLTYGIEEEVFIVQRGKPSLESLFYLASLLWRKGQFNYFHTGYNFSHLPDLSTGLMGGVEVSTEVCSDVDSLMRALIRRRKELAEVSSGLIVPVGHMFDGNSPTRTCGMHVHIGNLPDMETAYRNLAHFLPLLLLVTASSPCADGRYFGCSYRIHSCPFIGPLTGDPWHRFQDIIVSRRLKTLEVRIFDPVWDLSRIRTLVGVIQSIVRLGHDVGFDLSFYRLARREAVTTGYGELTGKLFNQLTQFCSVPQDLFETTSSDIVHDYYRENGQQSTLSALDNAYRNGRFEPAKFDGSLPNPAKIAVGIAGYFIPKLPYTLWKTCREMG